MFEASNPATTSQLVHKPGGTGALGTFATWPLGVAKYGFQAVQVYLENHHGIVSALVANGVSSGNDATPLAYNHMAGQFWVMPDAANAWAAIFLSVQSDAVGTVGGWINYRSSQPTPESTGAEILGLYYDGSIMPDHMPGNVFLEASADDMFNGSVTLPTNPNIVAFDWPIGLLNGGEGEPPPGIEHINRMYFTVTHACAQAWNAEISQPTGTPIPLSDQSRNGMITGATIFAVEYDANGDITTVEVLADHVSLGLSSTEDVDALAVGQPTQVNSLPLETYHPVDTAKLAIFFSLQPGLSAVSEEPLHVSAVVQDPQGPVRVRKPLRRKEGASITDGSKVLGSDNIDAICHFDPELGQGRSSLFGMPGLSEPLPPIGFSMSRNEVVVPNTVVVVASGWPATGEANSAMFLMTTIEPAHFTQLPSEWELCSPGNGETQCVSPVVEFLGVRVPGQATIEFTRSMPAGIGPLSAVIVQIPVGSMTKHYSMTLEIDP
ncbi:MAG: hypothetical protein NXI31_22435 [bacterium]|nr:hypothetical protein [bacterium]